MNVYDEVYKQYIENNVADEKNYQSLLKWIGKHVDITQNEVLDVGCGSGKFVRYLRSKSIDATGIEPSKAFYDPEKAFVLANKAVELCEEKRPDLFDTLAAAYAANGDFNNAIRTVSRAIDLAKELDQKQQIGEFQKHLEIYKAGQDLR